MFHVLGDKVTFQGICELVQVPEKFRNALLSLKQTNNKPYSSKWKEHLTFEWSEVIVVSSEANQNFAKLFVNAIPVQISPFICYLKTKFYL